MLKGALVGGSERMAWWKWLTFCVLRAQRRWQTVFYWASSHQKPENNWLCYNHLRYDFRTQFDAESVHYFNICLQPNKTILNWRHLPNRNVLYIPNIKVALLRTGQAGNVLCCCCGQASFWRFQWYRPLRNLIWYDTYNLCALQMLDCLTHTDSV